MNKPKIIMIILFVLNIVLVIVTDNLNLFWNVHQLTDRDWIFCNVIFGLSLICQIAFMILLISIFFIYVKQKKENLAFGALFLFALLITFLEMAYCVISYIFRVGFLFFP